MSEKKKADAANPNVKTPKAAKAKKAKETKPKKTSALDAAVRVLGEAGQPMACQEMIDAMGKAGLWTSPNGKTPASTLYSAILRELGKGKESRFVKADRGKFALAKK
jgi:hypothetical protein